MKTFPSKLLLFGEYTVLYGGHALALPLSKYTGRWAFGADPTQQSLAPFFDYLREQQLGFTIDLGRFEEELSKGLYFDSDIPTGYGLGSSGALCAAIYYRYAQERIGVEELDRQETLRRQLANLERFFHGSSSGIDPLICYLQQPLLLGQGNAERVRTKLPRPSSYAFFLLDTQLARRTAPFVDRFRTYCEEESFMQMVERQWAPLSERAIQQYLAGSHLALADTMAELSAVQFSHLKPWIPKAVQPCWRNGLESGQYSLKLCGAGGGGFLLGYGKVGASRSLPAGHPTVML